MKRCNDCGKSLPDQDFCPVRKSGIKSVGHCRACGKVRSRNNYIKHKSKRRESLEKWKADNPEKHKAYSLKSKAKSPGRALAQARAYRKRAVTDLKKWYVVEMITYNNDIDRSLITPEMVALKRQEMILNRTIKSLSK